MLASLMLLLVLYGLLLISLFAPVLIGVMIATGSKPKLYDSDVNPVVVAAVLFGSCLFATVVSFADLHVPSFWTSKETIGSFLVGEQFAPHFWIPVLAGLPPGCAFGCLWRSHMS